MPTSRGIAQSAGTLPLKIALERMHGMATAGLAGSSRSCSRTQSCTCGVVADGVVAAVVAELELEGLAAKGLPQHLVAHADPKHRLLAQNLLGVVHSVRGRGGVALYRGTSGARGQQGSGMQHTGRPTQPQRCGGVTAGGCCTALMVLCTAQTSLSRAGLADSPGLAGRVGSDGRFMYVQHARMHGIVRC